VNGAVKADNGDGKPGGQVPPPGPTPRSGQRRPIGSGRGGGLDRIAHRSTHLVRRADNDVSGVAQGRRQAAPE
jgi:hypothetical protein